MILKQTEQMREWQGAFGKEYTERNMMQYSEFEAFYEKMFGMTREAMNQKFLGDMDRKMRILEVGSNIGNQLLCLQKMGFENLFGIELQQSAVEIAKKRTQNIQIIQGTAFDVPFKDEFFDLVFTSGVLIHISPRDLPDVLKEVHRCTRRFIWGIEYWAKDMTEVDYRGHAMLLWKGDYAAEYQRLFPNLELVKEEKIRELQEPEKKNVDSMFLLRKKAN